jgi:hypothetical protein
MTDSNGFSVPVLCHARHSLRHTPCFVGGCQQCADPNTSLLIVCPSHAQMPLGHLVKLSSVAQFLVFIELYCKFQTEFCDLLVSGYERVSCKQLLHGRSCYRQPVDNRDCLYGIKASDRGYLNQL